jgi:ABC-type dipeptide/oligopeptide/nickel transport system ATPase component
VEHREAVIPVLAIRGLSIAAGGRLVVRTVSLTLPRGQTLALVGESGSGKSMTALAILRLLPPGARVASGEVLLRDDSGERDLLRLTEAEMCRVRGREIACVFQEPAGALNPVLTIGEQIEEVLRIRCALSRRQARDRALRLLAEVGINDADKRAGQYPHEFSGGMRQRALIALSLAAAPRVLLADEPTSALDAEHRLRILDLLASLSASRGMSLMLISHDLGLVRRHAHHVAVLYAGRVIERGPARAVLENPRHPYTRALLRCTPGAGEPRTNLPTIAGLMSGPGTRELPGSRRAWWTDVGDREPVYVEASPGHEVAGCADG